MSLEDYRTLFVVTILGLVLIAALPTVSMAVSIPSGAERFSELWVLGPTRMADGYPFTVRVGEQYRLFVGMGNHMGSSTYYVVYVKFRNQTQSLPDTLSAMPSPLPPLYDLRAFVGDGATWEAPLNFSFLEVSRFENSCLVGRMSINGVDFSVDCPSEWDSENGGFYYQLFFELWLYDTSLQRFQYHNRFVGIWLNMTG